MTTELRFESATLCVRLGLHLMRVGRAEGYDSAQAARVQQVQERARARDDRRFAKRRDA